MKKTVPAILAISCMIMILIISQPASAKQHHITLLTVGEVGEESFGGTADAYLEIKPGSGRIFLDSFPLTKIDTQISTRYANRIACDYLDMDCSNKDFFYTIRAGSTIVGGPSASASLTILTIAALKDIKLKNDTVMTGTINSGGSIGPVGGIDKKVKAAEKAGFNRVLVPLFSIEANGEGISNESNQSDTPKITSINISTTNKDNQTNITNIGITPESDGGNSEKTGQESNDDNITSDTASKTGAINISIVRIRNIDEAMAYFTDYNVTQANGEIIVPDDYTSTMRGIADSLCNRAILLESSLVLNESEKNMTADFLRKVNSSFSENNFYSAASYCFNMGVSLRKINFRQINSTNPSQLTEILLTTKDAVLEFNKNLEDRNITTLPELEAYIIVKERLIEAEEGLEKLEKNLSSDELAYAVERYYSAVFWSDFFKIKGKPIFIDNKFLEEACYKKLSEAEERINYAAIYLPFYLSNTQDSINEAYDHSEKKDYKMCLFKASFAKAEANLLLSSLSISMDQTSNLSNEKLKAAKKLIARQSSRGYFPIMGYSYYEYANSLNKNNDSISSLIFSEYALELSNMEMYFPKRKAAKAFIIDPSLSILVAAVFLLGLILGVIIGASSVMKAMRGKHKSERARKDNDRPKKE